MYDCTFSAFPDFQASFKESGVMSDAVNFTGGFGIAVAKCIPLERHRAKKHQIRNMKDKHEPLSVNRNNPLVRGAIFLFFDGVKYLNFP